MNKDFLDINARGKFIVVPSGQIRSIIEQIPDARKLPRKPVIALPVEVETWRILGPLLARGMLTHSLAAKEAITRLNRAYTLSRIAIKKAELRFKHNNEISCEIPSPTSPYSHQARAWGFATTLDAAALFMEQGTGKTLVALTVAMQRYLWGQVKRVLIVCPKSVVPVWPNQMRKHLGHPWSYDRISKKPQVSIRESFGPGINFLVVNYDKLKSRRKDIAQWNPDMVILDESHRIMNGTSSRSKECHRIGDKVTFKLILSGTPIGGDIKHVWSQFRFLDPNQFSRSFKCFKNNYCLVETKRNWKTGKDYDIIVGYKNKDQFNKRFHELTFRCKKSECLDLPEEISQTRYCQPSRETLRVYRELEIEKIVEIGDSTIEVERAISEIVKLRQITGGMVKDDEGKLVSVARDKLDALEEILEDKDWSNKLVIFVSFTHEIELISEILRKTHHGFLVLSGKTPEDQREVIEKTFTEDENIDTMLVQVDTGGEGLDFTAADLGIFYSPTFSFIKISQSKSRLHRMGQHYPVNYIFLLMEDTIDEKIIEYLDLYEELSSEILDGSRDYRLTKDKPMSQELQEALKELEEEFQNLPTKPKRKKKMAKKSKTKTEDEQVTKKKRKKKGDVAEAPKKAKKSKASGKKEKTGPASSKSDGYSAAQLAEELDVTPAELRRALRSIGAQKPGSAWLWPKKTDPGLKTLRTELKGYFKDLGAKKSGAPKKPGGKKPRAKKKAA